MQRLRRTGVIAASAAALLTQRAQGQVLEVQGGGSSLSRGYGGALNVWGEAYEGNVGIGYLDGVRFSVFLKHLVGRDTLRIGNDAIPVRFATDVLGSSNAILAQGVGVRRATRRSSLFAFVGSSATAIPAPFVNAVRHDQVIGVVQGERSLSPTVRLMSHALISGRQTILQGVKWESPRGLQAGATAGVGGNEPYGAASFALTRERMDVRAAYVEMGDRFRRSGVPTPAQTEVHRENVLITYRPWTGFSFGVGRQHFRQDSMLPGVADRATLNQIFGTARIAGASVAAGLFDSHTPGTRTVSSYLSASRDVTRWLQTDLYVLRVWSPEPARSTTPVVYLREFLTPRLNLLQVLTRTRDRTSVSFGGAFASGLTTLSVDYQIVHTPYRPRDPFVQTLAFTVRVPLGQYRVSATSFVTPDGRVNYAGSASTFYYIGDIGSGGVQPVEIRFERFIVEGRVVDEESRPVDGAAIAVGDEILFTDSHGRFFVRLASSKPLPLRVLPDEFLTPGQFDVVSAPSSAAPRREHQSSPVRIVVKRRLAPRPESGPASVGGVTRSSSGNLDPVSVPPG